MKASKIVRRSIQYEVSALPAGFYVASKCIAKKSTTWAVRFFDKGAKLKIVELLQFSELRDFLKIPADLAWSPLY
jgi:hypothetical protein